MAASRGRWYDAQSQSASPWRSTMSRPIPAVACLAFLMSAALAAAQSTARFQFTEKPGPYAVGLKVVHQYDYSRTWHSTVDELGQPYTGERARPLQTLIWYPAEKATGAAMTMRDYAMLRATETDFNAKPKPGSVLPADDGRKAAL